LPQKGQSLKAIGASFGVQRLRRVARDQPVNSQRGSVACASLKALCRRGAGGGCKGRAAGAAAEIDCERPVVAVAKSPKRKG
jgi:hypothetical protein